MASLPVVFKVAHYTIDFNNKKCCIIFVYSTVNQTLLLKFNIQSRSRDLTQYKSEWIDLVYFYKKKPGFNITEIKIEFFIVLASIEWH